jgi:hypothetical protein
MSSDNSDNCIKCLINWQDASIDGSDIIGRNFIIGKNLVAMSLYGTIKIINEDLTSDQGVLCDKCLSQMAFEPYLSFECNKCHKQFTDIFLPFGYKSNSAYGCASIVCDNHIKCNFGSKFDSDRESEFVKFVGERPDNIICGSNLCDVCIDELINTGICAYNL